MSRDIVGFCCLHYGADFLGYSIRSVIDYVDRFWCVYTPEGSHGHKSPIPCPDTRDQLYAIAKAAAGDKLRWTEGVFPYEGAHRGMIHQLEPDTAMIVVTDSDEIWQPSLIQSVIDYAFTVTVSIPPFRYMRVPIIHYWRSFYRAVLHDPAFPVRVIFPQIDEKYGENTYGRGVINHMGYSQRSEIVRYKMTTHGHRGEFRKDVDWFTDVFMANRQHDCHIVGSEYWNPEPVNPWQYLPDFMRQHPYANLQVIE